MDDEIPEYIVPNVDFLREIANSMGDLSKMSDPQIAEAFQMMGVPSPEVLVHLKRQDFVINQEITARGIRMLRIVARS